MTALVHGVVVSLPDNPAYEVSKNAWNQAHPLPGTIGQLFASDGASGVDAIPQLVYNSTTGSFNVAVDSALGGVFQIYDVQGTRGMFAFDPNAGNLSADKLMPVTALSGLLDLGGPANLWKTLYIGTTTAYAFQETTGVLELGSPDLTFGDLFGAKAVTIKGGDGYIVAAGLADITGAAIHTTSATLAAMVCGNAQVGVDISGIIAFGCDDGLASFVSASQFGPLPTPESGAAQLAALISKLDLGSAAAPWRTGYFGTSVVVDPMGTGLVDAASYSVGGTPGADGTVSGADLVAQSLSFVKGIYVGLV